MKTRITIPLLLLYLNIFCLSQSKALEIPKDTIHSKKQAEPEKKHKTSRQAKRSLVFGFKGGFNRSNVYDSQGESFVAGKKNGYAAGLFMAIPFDGFSGLQPELLFSQRGFRSTGTINNDPYSLDRTSAYLDVPLHLQLKPFRFFSILLGMQYSRLLQQQDRLGYGTNTTMQQQEFSSDNPRTDLLGTSIGFDVNIRHFVISYRTCRDLIANRVSGSTYTPRYKNTWAQVTIGYRFY